MPESLSQFTGIWAVFAKVAHAYPSARTERPMCPIPKALKNSHIKISSFERLEHTLFSLTGEGQISRLLVCTNRWGVPYMGVLVITL